jgi:intracellular sulfur oxidation DsrE/DsrF family protein
MTKQDQGAIARRSVVTALGTGVLALGAATTPRNAAAKEAGWQPTLEAQDEWMELPGRHRLVFDATSAQGAAESLFYAKNYTNINKSAYGIEPAQLATIIILRHAGTVFGYDDAMWAKYGKVFSGMSKFVDPKTKEAPTRNLFDMKDADPGLPNNGATVSELAGQGVQFAICGAATTLIASMIARQTKGKAEDVHQELASHLVANGRLVPAGIVAVNRAQERGYAVAYYTE